MHYIIHHVEIECKNSIDLFSHSSIKCIAGARLDPHRLVAAQSGPFGGPLWVVLLREQHLHVQRVVWVFSLVPQEGGRPGRDAIAPSSKGVARILLAIFFMPKGDPLSKAVAPKLWAVTPREIAETSQGRGGILVGKNHLLIQGLAALRLWSTGCN